MPLASPSGLRDSSSFYLTCNHSQWLVVENFVMDRLPDAVAWWVQKVVRDCRALSKEEIADVTPCLRAAGEMLEPDRISGSLFLARATERQSGRALSHRCGKVLRFPTICSLLRFRVLLPAGSLGRFAQAQFTVTRKWPQAESVVIRNSQAVPGRCSRVAVGMG